MKKILVLVALFASSFIANAQSDLIGMLTKEMGISQSQAEGGAGALFGLAKEGMSAPDFSSLSKVIPDMSGLLGAVPSLGGGKTSMLGKAAQSLTGMPAVTAAFEKLGMNQTHVALMTPMLVGYVEDKGGKALSGLFSKAIGG